LWTTNGGAPAQVPVDVKDVIDDDDEDADLLVNRFEYCDDRHNTAERVCANS
jgi:hypothetical protein